MLNRPFRVICSKSSQFQMETKSKNFLVKINFICMRIKNHFHINGFARSLALEQRIEATQKWPSLHRSCFSPVMQRSSPGELCDKTKTAARETRNCLNLKNIAIPLVWLVSKGLLSPLPVLINISGGRRVEEGRWFHIGFYGQFRHEIG